MAAALSALLFPVLPALPCSLPAGYFRSSGASCRLCESSTALSWALYVVLGVACLALVAFLVVQTLRHSRKVANKVQDVQVRPTLTPLSLTLPITPHPCRSPPICHLLPLLLFVFAHIIYSLRSRSFSTFFKSRGWLRGSRFAGNNLLLRLVIARCLARCHAPHLQAQRVSLSLNPVRVAGRLRVASSYSCLRFTGPPQSGHYFRSLRSAVPQGPLYW